MGTWIYGTAYVTSGQYDQGDTVTNSGTLVVEPNGEVDATNVWGTLDVSGGTAVDTHLYGGTLNVGNGAGGTAYGTEVMDGGVLNVTNLGTSWYADINGGSEHVGDGGTSQYSTINSGAMTVDHGGFADNTTINYSTEYVSGLDANATLKGGSTEVIEAGGVSVFAHAEGYNNGLLVEAGGAAYGATLDKGSWMFVADGGKADVIDFAGSNASVTFAAWHDSAGTTIEGFGIQDEIDFRGMVAGTGATLTCAENAQNTAAVLTLKDAIGQTTSLTLMGQHSAAEFSYGFDGAGGIAVTDHGLSLAGPLAAHLLLV